MQKSQKSAIFNYLRAANAAKPFDIVAPVTIFCIAFVLRYIWHNPLYDYIDFSDDRGLTDWRFYILLWYVELGAVIFFLYRVVTSLLSVPPPLPSPPVSVYDRVQEAQYEASIARAEAEKTIAARISKPPQVAQKYKTEKTR